MSGPRRIATVLVMALAFSACGGAGQAKTCEDIAVKTIETIQSLIDDVDVEAETISLQDFLDGKVDLPSLDAFADAFGALEKRSAELGCSDQEVASGVASKLGQLSAKSELGRFVIDLLISGGL